MDAPARRRRKPKSALSLWIVEQREAQPTEDGKGWTSGQLADKLGVSDSTVRGWEAGRSVSSDNLAQLERLFGVEAPGRDEPNDGQALVAAAIRDQTDRMEAAIQAQTAMLAAVLSRLGGLPVPEAEAEAETAIASTSGRLPHRLPDPTPAGR